MGDGQHAQVLLVGHGLDAPAAGPQGVDVETRVELVEDGEAGGEHGELEGLVALLLATREIDVERPGQELLAEADAIGLGLHGLVHGPRVTPGGHGRLGQDRLEADPGHLGRVLHGQEQPGVGPLPGFEGQHVDVVEEHGAAGDGVAGPTHDHVGQGRLPGAVRAHDGVDLAAAHDQIDPLEDLPACHLGPEALDAQLAHERAATVTSTSTSSPSTRTS